MSLQANYIYLTSGSMRQAGLLLGVRAAAAAAAVVGVSPAVTSQTAGRRPRRWQPRLGGSWR